MTTLKLQNTSHGTDAKQKNPVPTHKLANMSMESG